VLHIGINYYNYGSGFIRKQVPHVVEKYLKRFV